MFKIVILAGGKSSRMGENKALLPLKNKKLIEHMLSITTPIAGENLLISGHVEGFEGIEDNIKNKGPLGGVEAIYKKYMDTTGHFLFIPVDMPCLTTHVLKKIINASSNTFNKAIHFQNFVMPLLLPATANIYKLIYAALQASEAKERSIKTLLNKLDTIELNTNGLEQHFINTNTPEEWQSFLRETGNEGPH